MELEYRTSTVTDSSESELKGSTGIPASLFLLRRIKTIATGDGKSRTLREFTPKQSSGLNRFLLRVYFSSSLNKELPQRLEIFCIK